MVEPSGEFEGPLQFHGHSPQQQYNVPLSIRKCMSKSNLDTKLQEVDFVPWDCWKIQSNLLGPLGPQALV